MRKKYFLGFPLEMGMVLGLDPVLDLPSLDLVLVLELVLALVLESDLALVQDSLGPYCLAK
jgi:hypothetical protein